MGVFTFRKKFSKARLIVLIAVCVLAAVLIAGLIVGDYFCAKYFPEITTYMNGQGTHDEDGDTVAARSAGNKLAARVEEEGAVLLKNNGALPLKNTKVNVFGWTSSDNGYLVQGTGSGTGARNDTVTFMQSLKYAGCDEDTVLEYAGKADYEPGGKLAGQNPFANGETGIEYNEELAEAYADLPYRRIEGGSYVIEAGNDKYGVYYGVQEAPESFYTSELMTNAREFSDTAIVVLGRLMGEGNDYSKYQYYPDNSYDEDRQLLELSPDEEAMLEQASTFDNVIVILNTTNPMETGFIEESKYNIDACLYIGTPGTRGALGVADILIGDVSPSGHLSDTMAYELSTAASYATSGREGQGAYTDISNGQFDPRNGANRYRDYIEDIYVGYKWYETADEMGFWDSADARERWGIENGYDDVVQFPFGFGLSYSEFEWSVDSISPDDGATLTADGKITLNVVVKNVGDVAAKDVVQVYYSAPYYTGGIEKSSINLVAFAKSKLLEPDESEIIPISFDVEDMKSYDCYDRNDNGFMGYELEAGEYEITLRTDVHTLKEIERGRGQNTYTFTVPSADGEKTGFKYETDSATGNKVENRFTTFTNESTGASSEIYEPAVLAAHSIDGSEEPTKLTYVTRADFAGTFPYEKEPNRAAGKELYDTTYRIKIMPVNKVYGDDASVTVPACDSKETNYLITDLYGIEYDDPMWDDLVSQLSFEEKMQLVVNAGDKNPSGFRSMAIPRLGKQETLDSDGPSGFNNNVLGKNDMKAVNYPCSTILAQTWDWYTAYQVGLAIGEEGNALGITGWYGPGGELHRSPLGGRNFEYYSEDPVLSGTICAYHVLGAKERGVTAYIKHFVGNNMESGRCGAYEWMTEQNLRENYLRAFEIAVKEGESNGLMSSVDRIGTTRVGGSYALLTSVLRNEWGFRGTVITDYYQVQNGDSGDNPDSSDSTGTWSSGYIHDIDEFMRAGNARILIAVGNVNWIDDQTSNTAKLAIHNSAKDILYTYADTLNFAETAQGLEKGSMAYKETGTFPSWVFLVVAIHIVVIGGLLVGLWFVVHEPKKKTPSEASAE